MYIDRVSQSKLFDIVVMPMKHAPEIGAENPYQNWYHKPARTYSIVLRPIRYRKSVPEKFGTELHVRRGRNR